jgi:hypothetical protein
MVFRVALQYPNGRTHEAILDRAETPRIGTQFVMYGRTWRVYEFGNGPGVRRRVNQADELTLYMCVCVVD